MIRSDSRLSENRGRGRAEAPANEPPVRRWMPGRPHDWHLCGCAHEDPFEVLRRLAPVCQPLDWCWGHALLRPGKAIPPFLYLDCAAPVGIRLAAALARKRGGADRCFDWRLRPLLADEAVRWVLSAEWLNLVPVWRPDELAAAWRRVTDELVEAWWTGLAKQELPPEAPQEQNEHQREQYEANPPDEWVVPTIIRATRSRTGHASPAQGTGPIEHEDEQYALLKADVKTVALQDCCDPSDPWPPVRWRLARWCYRMVDHFRWLWAADLAFTEPWWLAPIDPRIRPLVAAMQAIGMRTVSSCAGHRLSPFAPMGPSVAFEAPVSLVLRFAREIEAAARRVPPVLLFPWRVSGWVDAHERLTWTLGSPVLDSGRGRRAEIMGDVLTLVAVVMNLRNAQGASAAGLGTGVAVERGEPVGEGRVRHEQTEHGDQGQGRPEAVFADAPEHAAAGIGRYQTGGAPVGLQLAPAVQRRADGGGQHVPAEAVRQDREQGQCD